MKKIFIVSGLFTIVSTFLLTSFINNIEPWEKKQLIKAEDLAGILMDDNKINDPVILNIGPSGAIRGSIEVGPVNTDEGIKKLQEHIANLSKEKHVVIYCGCCPFEHCPNIRPAFSLLTKNGFRNHQLLNLPQNLKVDWIDKGYPMEE
ncbi:MAG: rhodanese-like domain-containing protein [Cytophagaceae bacterium]